MYRAFRCLAALLSAAMLLAPLSAAARDSAETVTLPPPTEKLPPFVGAAQIDCDRSMNGSRFEIYRIQEEGTFLHYSYDIALREDFTAICPLCEGHFLLVLYVPGEQETCSEYRYEFDCSDTDTNPPLPYTETQMIFRLRTDAALTETDVQTAEPVIEDKVLSQEVQYTFARADFSLGDLNTDGKTDAGDATEILIAAAAVGAGSASGFSSLQAAQADIDGNGSFNSADATSLLIYAAGKGSGDITADILTYMRSLD